MTISGVVFQAAMAERRDSAPVGNASAVVVRMRERVVEMVKEQS